MNGADRIPEEVDPDSTPFESMAIAGLPFKRGSEEDEAIQRVIREADARRAREE